MKKYEDFDDFEEIGADSGSYDFKALFEVVLKSWKKILVWALCGAAFGMMIGLSKPKTYTAKAVVAPEITTRTGAGGLSSLASLAGINMNTMALTDAMHPDLYPEIIKSTNFYIDLFDMPVTFEHKDTLVHTDLYDYMVNYAKSPWWGTVLGLPWKAMEGNKKLFGKVDEFDDAEGASFRRIFQFFSWSLPKIDGGVSHIPRLHDIGGKTVGQLQFHNSFLRYSEGVCQVRGIARLVVIIAVISEQL